MTAELAAGPVPSKLATVTGEAFEGGGMRGHTVTPILEAFGRWRLPIVKHAGTSAGAILALLRALGHSADAIRQVQETTPWNDFMEGSNWLRIPRLILTGGMYANGVTRAWLERRLAVADQPAGLTFRALYRRTGHSLHVGVTVYSRRRGLRARAEPLVYGPDTTPDVSIVDAVHASMSVPGIWPPVLAGPWWGTDGGAAINHPLSVFEHDAPETVVGVRFDAPDDVAELEDDTAKDALRPGFRDLVAAQATMLMRIAERQYVPSALWDRVIRVQVPEGGAFDFDLGAERLAALRDAGARALVDWLAK